MEILPVHATHPDPAVIRRAADVLRAGGLVAMPTETVYGLAGVALEPAHLQRIYAAKGRPGWNPLIAHVTDAAMARGAVVAEWPPAAEALAAAFWPGPLTLVLPRQPGVPDALTAGLSTVAVRAPSHAVARALIAAVGAPLAAPSANRFMHISPTRAEHVVRSLGDAVDLVLDAGACSVGVESTVVDLSVSPPRLLRAGGVTLEQLRAVVPDVAHGEGAVADGTARASPGMVERHYAPDAVVLRVPHGDGDAAARAIPLLPQPRGAVVFTVSAEGTVCRLALEVAEAQRDFYGALHQLEAAGCRGILVEDPPPGPAWDALRDRMRRSAHPAAPTPP